MSTRIAAVFSSDLTNAKIGRAWLTYLPTADQTQFPDFIVSVYLSEATLVCLSVCLPRVSLSLEHLTVFICLSIPLCWYCSSPASTHTALELPLLFVDSITIEKAIRCGFGHLPAVLRALASTC